MKPSDRVCCLALLFTGCAVGSPPGFSPGGTWTFPLVDPLADGKLVTPVYIDGDGPYLFAIDPDAPVTVVDRSVALRSPFSIKNGGRVTDEQDTTHPAQHKTVRQVRIGDLTVSLLDVQISRDHAFDLADRRISGILGRDVITDSLVFGFDRERGVAWLSTQESFHPAEGALTLAYAKGTRQTPHVVRRLVTTNVDGAAFDLHLDLGDVPSQLWSGHWARARLSPVQIDRTLVDETGHRRQTSLDGVAATVNAAGVTRDRISFVSYDDRRWDGSQQDGTLGLEFFRPFAVAADWHHERYFLTARQPSASAAAARLARWGTAMTSRCEAPGCVGVRFEPSASTGSDTGAVVHVTRDPASTGQPLEVVFAATSASGTALPPISVHLTAESGGFDAVLDRQYANATLSVLDISPFPRACGGCITTDPTAPNKRTTSAMW